MTIWPFKRKYPDINALPPVSLDGDNNWGVAQTDDDGSPLIVRYNQAARDWCGHPKLPVKLGFAIPLNRTNEGGLPDSDENRQLNEIEDLLLREIDGRTRAMHALTLTTGKMREFVFYVPQGTDIKSLHEMIRSAVATHEVDCMADIERDWDTYRQFSPE